MSRALYAALAAFAILGTGGQAFSQSAPQGLYRCGSRPGVSYAAVFDASSSLREDEDSRTKTVNEYVKVLRLLSGSLCESDSLFIHVFAPDAAHRMIPLHVLTPANRSAGMLRQFANSVIDAHTGHTDLHLTLESIKADLFPNHGILAAFLITDGSLYPRTPTAADRTVEGLQDRLDALASLADSLRTPLTDRSGLAGGTPFLYVIGVRSDDAWAVDRALGAELERPRSTRLWRGGARPVDLRDDKGTHLLEAVFEDRFTRLEDLSLWSLFLDTEDGLWTRHFSYSDGWGFTLQRLQQLTLRHLLFLPRAESTNCPSLQGPALRRTLSPVSISISAEGRILCSVENPTQEQIAALGRDGVKEFAILQGGARTPVGSLSAMRGLHDFVLADSGQSCERATVAAQFDGDPWPPRRAFPVATMWTERLGSAEDGKAPREEMNLIRLPLSHCLVPGFSGRQWERPEGEYAVFVRESGGTTVYGGRFEPSPAKVVEQFVRPAGFPFPADDLALVRVCVERTDELAKDEQMWMWLHGKLLPLTAERARERCKAGPRERGAHLYGFSGLALLDGNDIATARIFLGHSADGLPPTSADLWVPVELNVDGKLFLSWGGLISVFLAGFAIQFFYLLLGTELGRQEGVFILFRVSTLASGTLSGILVSVAAEVWRMVREADIGADKVPVIFALSIFAHMMKIAAAALIPEHVEECVFD